MSDSSPPGAARPAAPSTDYGELEQRLLRRLEVVGDHAWRDRDPSGHLDALRGASEAIDEWHRRHADGLPPRLRHFLANASFDKALAWVSDQRE